jgi:hypothetical protein
VKPLNFPQPEELARAGQRCDEQDIPLLSLSLASEPRAATQGSAAAAQDASAQRPPQLGAKKPGKSGFFGVSKNAQKCNKSTPW